MRRILTFQSEGALLSATLDPGHAATGLLIVSGGNEIRIGAQRGMATLAQTISGAGHPVFRFDRRGVGDSEGVNGGYATSSPDIEAAAREFRSACPYVTRIVAFGNCDAATALVLHNSPVEARVLGNPWVVETADAMPPVAAIRDRYSRRLRDPAAWAALLSGKIDFRAAAKGLGRIALPDRMHGNLVKAFALSIANRPTTIILAERDNTAIAFANVWKTDAFIEARRGVSVVSIDSASHSFSADPDRAALTSLLLKTLRA